MNSLLTVALTSHLVPDLPTLSAGSWRSVSPLIESGSSAEAVLQFALQNFDAADKEAATLRIDHLSGFEDQALDLQEKGVLAVTWFDDRFPRRVAKRLGQRTPPLLFAGGNLSLLNAEGVAIVGSREVGEEGTAFASEVAQGCVHKGACVVSGGARGVDIVSMTAAVSAGGSCVGYMSDSLSKGLRSPAMRDALDEGRLCLASPFSPSVGFLVANAMARNKLIYAHALASVVVSSAEGEGGTWAGACEALRLGLVPVLVRSGHGVPTGNAALIKKGCVPLERADQLWDQIASYAPSQANFAF